MKVSPYELNNEALRILNECPSDKLSDYAEEQVLLLINRSSEYPNMSTYQLSLSRKKLAEYYMSLGITGSALEQYQMALSLNSHLPIKKVIKSLLHIPKEQLIYSIDANISGDPDFIQTRTKRELPDFKPTAIDTIQCTVLFREFADGIWTAMSNDILNLSLKSNNLKNLTNEVTNAVLKLIEPYGSIDSVEHEPSERTWEQKLIFNISAASNNLQDLKHALFHGQTIEEYRSDWNNLLNKTCQKIQEEAALEDSVYDPDFDKYIQKELDKLGPEYRKGFQELVARRDYEKDYFFSYKKWAELTLESMRASKEYQDKKKGQSCLQVKE